MLKWLINLRKASRWNLRHLAYGINLLSVFWHAFTTCVITALTLFTSLILLTRLFPTFPASEFILIWSFYSTSATWKLVSSGQRIQTSQVALVQTKQVKKRWCILEHVEQSCFGWKLLWINIGHWTVLNSVAVEGNITGSSYDVIMSRNSVVLSLDTEFHSTDFQLVASDWLSSGFAIDAIAATGISSCAAFSTSFSRRKAVIEKKHVARATLPLPILPSAFCPSTPVFLHSRETARCSHGSSPTQYRETTTQRSVRGGDLIVDAASLDELLIWTNREAVGTDNNSQRGGEISPGFCHEAFMPAPFFVCCYLYRAVTVCVSRGLARDNVICPLKKTRWTLIKVSALSPPVVLSRRTHGRHQRR